MARKASDYEITYDIGERELEVAIGRKLLGDADKYTESLLLIRDESDELIDDDIIKKMIRKGLIRKSEKFVALSPMNVERLEEEERDAIEYMREIARRNEEYEKETGKVSFINPDVSKYPVIHKSIEERKDTQYGPIRQWDVTEDGKKLANDPDMLELASGTGYNSDKAAMLISLAYFDDIPKFEQSTAPIYEGGAYSKLSLEGEIKHEIPLLKIIRKLFGKNLEVSENEDWKAGRLKSVIFTRYASELLEALQNEGLVRVTTEGLPEHVRADVYFEKQRGPINSFKIKDYRLTDYGIDMVKEGNIPENCKRVINLLINDSGAGRHYRVWGEENISPEDIDISVEELDECIKRGLIVYPEMLIRESMCVPSYFFELTDEGIDMLKGDLSHEVAGVQHAIRLTILENIHEENGYPLDITNVLSMMNAGYVKRPDNFIKIEDFSYASSYTLTPLGEAVLENLPPYIERLIEDSTNSKYELTLLGKTFLPRMLEGEAFPKSVTVYHSSDEEKLARKIIMECLGNGRMTGTELRKCVEEKMTPSKYFHLEGVVDALHGGGMVSLGIFDDYNYWPSRIKEFEWLPPEDYDIYDYVKYQLLPRIKDRLIEDYPTEWFNRMIDEGLIEKRIKML